MSLAAAETPLDPTPAIPAIVEPPADPDPIMDEARIGIEKLREMSPNELRAVIASRVDLLQNVLQEREARRDAIRTARLAARLYDLRRERSRRIHRQVNVGSALAAVASTMLIILVMV